MTRFKGKSRLQKKTIAPHLFSDIKTYSDQGIGGTRQERVPDFQKGTRKERNHKNQRTRSFCVPFMSVFQFEVTKQKNGKITSQNANY